MPPRLIAGRDDCTGGTCPAIFADDADLMPDEFAVVGPRPSDGLAGRIASRIAPHEAAIVIHRDLLVQALHPAPETVSGEDLRAEFRTFHYSACRIEQRQDYEDTGPDPEWAALVRANIRWGKSHQRVHIVTEPLSSGMREEIADGYPGSVAAGEDIRILPLSELADWPDAVPHQDFWLFDSSRLYLMDYASDGTWTGVRRVTDPEQIVEACRARDAALHQATPWQAYVASRPHLQTRVAQ